MCCSKQLFTQLHMWMHANNRSTCTVNIMRTTSADCYRPFPTAAVPVHNNIIQLPLSSFVTSFVTVAQRASFCVVMD